MSKPIESLSKTEARKLVLHSQQLPPVKQKGSALDASLAAMENLGYVQIDTISVIQRAHHHTFWSRNPRYKIDHLDKLVAKKQVFEYWSHAAAFLPMCDYRYTLPQKLAIKNGQQDHWYERDEKLMNSILARIRAEGPLMVKDFDGEDKFIGEWRSKPSKRALEYLFMQGDLMIPRRNNFHKVYDLTERVLPDGVDSSVPTEKEFIRFLITSYLKANGLGQASEICYLRKNVKPLVVAALNEMTATGELIKVKVGDESYFALPASLELLNKPLSKSKLKILSPFDNLLIQRKRTLALFDFDYLIECYVPAAKRKFGYFVLPILWDGKLLARMDCKADRKTAVLHIYNLVLEPSLKKTEAFAQALRKELEAFMEFNHCTKVEIHKTDPINFKSIFELILNKSGD